MARWEPVPVVGGCGQDDDRPFTVQDTCNYAVVSAEMEGTRSSSMLRSLPGMDLFTTLTFGEGDPDIVKNRGARVVQGRFFVVAWTRLMEIFADGTFTDRGGIPGTGRVSMSHNQITNGNQLIIVTGSSGYIFNTVTNTLTKITDDGYPGAIVADFIAQLFVQIEPQRRYFFNSDLADGLAYNALETYEGEASPDRMMSLIVNHSEVIVFSETTTEVFDYTGTTNALFENKKIVIERGCGATFTPCSLDNSVFFVGNDGGGYRIDGYTPVRITTHQIEQAWAQCDLSKAFAFTWEDRGHKVWYVTFPDGYTWGYDCATRLWHRRQSYGLTRCRLATLVKWRGEWYGGDMRSGKIFKLNWNTMTEDSAEYVSERVTGVGHDNENRLTVHALKLLFDTGQPSTSASDHFCEIRYSRNGGNTWSDFTQHSLGAVGKFLKTVMKTRIGSGGLEHGEQIVFHWRVSSPAKRDVLSGSIKLENE